MSTFPDSITVAITNASADANTHDRAHCNPDFNSDDRAYCNSNVNPDCCPNPRAHAYPAIERRVYRTGGRRATDDRSGLGSDQERG